VFKEKDVSVSGEGNGSVLTIVRVIKLAVSQPIME
jgi:hypothetical protein